MKIRLEAAVIVGKEGYAQESLFSYKRYLVTFPSKKRQQHKRLTVSWHEFLEDSGYILVSHLSLTHRHHKKARNY